MKEDVIYGSKIRYVDNEKFVHCYGSMKEEAHFRDLGVDGKIIVSEDVSYIN
jgi:hypothetical protein